MPKFRNVTKNTINIISNGRKMSIPPNGEISGPPEYVSYSGLRAIDGIGAPEGKSIDITKSLLAAKNLSSRVSNSTLVQAHNKNIITPNVRSNHPTRYSMMKIPDIVPIDETFDKNKEIEKTKSYLYNYPHRLPTIGICILTKNSLDLIKDCCDSIFDKVMYPATKIYIFDTGTTEQAVLKYYAEIKSDKKFPVEIINVGNYHFGSNYNTGVDKVDTDFVMIQNNDTKVLTDYISKLMRISIIEKVGMTGPRMLHKNGTIQHDGQRLYNAEGKLENPGHVNYGAPRELPGGRHVVDGITAAGVLMQTKWFKHIGKFDAGFKDIYQDVHLCMRNRQEGKISVCDRDAIIYHYDNTSRKLLWNDPRKVADMGKDHNYLYAKVNSGELSFTRKAKRKFSIITLVNNNQQYFDFLEDIRKQNTRDSFEIIALPNYNNEYKSCAQALNVGMDISEAEYCIICHQDLKMGPDWLSKISSHIDELNSHGVYWGTLGMAGGLRTAKDHDIAAIYLDNKDMGKGSNDETCVDIYSKKYGKRVEVQTLDELCIITKTNIGIRFDEVNFSHYHWYGADFCLNSLSRGYKNYAIDASCFHISDGFSNLLKDDHKAKFLEGAANLYSKWRKLYPFFRTMTTSFSKTIKPDGTESNYIQFYVAEELNKRNSSFPKAISLS